MKIKKIVLSTQIDNFRVANLNLIMKVRLCAKFLL